jgi:predicted 3-demethylubiquinone-9 3-methyltransferase (glyoxalase superfamily)
MPKTTACLWFDRQGEDAANFYVSLFPNSQVTNVTRYGPGMPQPEGSVLTVEFELDGTSYVALNGGPEFTFSEAISFQIDCADQAEVDRYWDAFADGGEPGPCGWIKDRFGLSWQVIPRALPELMSDPDPGRAQRATAAMMQMGKIDVAELHAAADAP